MTQKFWQERLKNIFCKGKGEKNLSIGTNCAFQVFICTMVSFFLLLDIVCLESLNFAITFLSDMTEAQKINWWTMLNLRLIIQLSEVHLVKAVCISNKKLGKTYSMLFLPICFGSWKEPFYPVNMFFHSSNLLFLSQM